MNQHSVEKKPKKNNKSTKTKKTKSSTTTCSKSKAKGGNFLGTVGDLVSPSGWETFATAAGLLALDRADAALRRGTKEKKEKMKGGDCTEIKSKTTADTMVLINRPNVYKEENIKLMKNYNTLKGNAINNPKYILGDNDFEGKISCDGDYFEVSIEMYCGPKSRITYKPTDNFNKFNTFDEAKKWLSLRKNQLALINLGLLNHHEICKNPNYKSAFYKSAFNLRK
jgi:hypothetical protein